MQNGMITERSIRSMGSISRLKEPSVNASSYGSSASFSSVHSSTDARFVNAGAGTGAGAGAGGTSASAAASGSALESGSSSESVPSEINSSNFDSTGQYNRDNRDILSHLSSTTGDEGVEGSLEDDGKSVESYYS